MEEGIYSTLGKTRAYEGPPAHTTPDYCDLP